MSNDTNSHHPDNYQGSSFVWTLHGLVYLEKILRLYSLYCPLHCHWDGQGFLCFCRDLQYSLRDAPQGWSYTDFPRDIIVSKQVLITCPSVQLIYLGMEDAWDVLIQINPERKWSSIDGEGDINCSRHLHFQLFQDQSTWYLNTVAMVTFWTT